MPTRTNRYLVLGVLILAGEAAFSLPFHVSRYFRATTLEVFAFSNTQLGDAFAVYGVTAMVSYFLGGPLADRFSVRKLIAVSLFSTGAGGFYMATIPGHTGATILFGYWGVTTILFLWAAMIRATREWGGTAAQGRAFGLLDGGRGLAAAAMASLAVVCFGLFLPREVAEITSADRIAALRAVIYFYTAMTMLGGALALIFIPDSGADSRGGRGSPLPALREIMRLPVVWAQAMIVVCAYCAYKGLDNYSLYAVEVLDMSELGAAQFTASAAYIRVLAAISAGFLADRFTARRTLGGLFMALTISYMALAASTPSAGLIAVIYGNLFVTYAGAFGLRGIYFALLEETDIPSHRTGTAVGVISMVGFTPEIFFASIAGRILDYSPGVGGHQNFFAFLAVIAALGTLTFFVLAYLVKRQRSDRQPAP